MFLQLLRLKDKDLPSLVCDPKELADLLTVSSNSTVRMQQISSEMCRMNETMLEKVFSKVVDQMNIGTLLKDVSAPSDFG